MRHCLLGEVLDIVSQSVNVSWRHGSNLLRRSMLRKLSLRKEVAKTTHVGAMDKVDEGIAHIGPVLNVHGQIKEIVLAAETFVVYLCQQVTLHILIRYIPQHGCGFFRFTTSGCLRLQIDGLWHILGVIGFEALRLRTPSLTLLIPRAASGAAAGV